LQDALAGQECSYSCHHALAMVRVPQYGAAVYPIWHLHIFCLRLTLSKLTCIHL